MEGEILMMEAWEKDPESGKIKVTYIANDVFMETIDEPLESLCQMESMQT